MAAKKESKMERYERSSADKKADRAGAKKAGESVKKFEGSKADEREDRRGAAKMRGRR